MHPVGVKKSCKTVQEQPETLNSPTLKQAVLAILVMATMTLQQALKEMEQLDERARPRPFSVEYVTCDLNRDTGGEIVYLNNVILTKHVDLWQGKRRTQRQRRAAKGKKSSLEENGTRNFYHTISGQIRQAHIRLITKYNNYEIIP